MAEQVGLDFFGAGEHYRNIVPISSPKPSGVEVLPALPRILSGRAARSFCAAGSAERPLWPSDGRRPHVHEYMIGTRIDMQCYDNLYIDGGWATPSSVETITIASTATGSIGSIPLAQKADIDAAVDAARRVVDRPTGWARLTPTARARALRLFANAIGARRNEFAHIASMQPASPQHASIPLEDLLRGCAHAIEDLDTTVGPSTHRLREPVGVVGAPVPWSFPQTQGFMTIVPALAAGCAVVLKPTVVVAPYSDAVFDAFLLDAFLLAEAAVESELPPGVLNVVPGIPALGAYVVTHAQIDLIALTGHGCRNPVSRPSGSRSALAQQIRDWTTARPTESWLTA